jgi:hypothetical protein
VAISSMISSIVATILHKFPHGASMVTAFARDPLVTMATVTPGCARLAGLAGLQVVERVLLGEHEAPQTPRDV